jgi:hypothetical protein
VTRDPARAAMRASAIKVIAVEVITLLALFALQQAFTR